MWIYKQPRHVDTVNTHSGQSTAGRQELSRLIEGDRVYGVRVHYFEMYVWQSTDYSVPIDHVYLK